MERQDPEYRSFVEALVAAVATANPGVLLVAGMPAWLHRLTALAGLAALAALAAVMGQALLNGSLPIALFTGALGAYCGWWTWRYLGRNRPRAFRAGAIPPDVLPPDGAPRP